MSLNITFVAVQPDDMALLLGDPTSVDDFVSRESGFQAVLVLTGRWDALQQALSGAGFRSSHFIDEVLSNGCEVVEPDLVFRQAQQLAAVDEAALHRTLLAAWQHPQEAGAQAKAYRALAGFYADASLRSFGVLFFAE